MRERDKEFIPGDNWIIDDQTGLKIRAKDARRQWDGLVVDKDVVERRNPQDFVRSIPDGKPPQIIRNRTPDVFTGPIATETTEASAAGDISLRVTSSQNMVVGDRLTIMLTNGDTFQTTIVTLYEIGYLLNEDGTRIQLEDGSGFLLWEDQEDTSGAIGIADALPYGVDVGAMVYDYTQLSTPSQL